MVPCNTHWSWIRSHILINMHFILANFLFHSIADWCTKDFVVFLSVLLISQLFSLVCWFITIIIFFLSCKHSNWYVIFWKGSFQNANWFCTNTNLSEGLCLCMRSACLCFPGLSAYASLVCLPMLPWSVCLCFHGLPVCFSGLSVCVSLVCLSVNSWSACLCFPLWNSVIPEKKYFSL